MSAIYTFESSEDEDRESVTESLEVSNSSVLSANYGYRFEDDDLPPGVVEEIQRRRGVPLHDPVRGSEIDWDDLYDDLSDDA